MAGVKPRYVYEARNETQKESCWFESDQPLKLGKCYTFKWKNEPKQTFVMKSLHIKIP